MSAFMPCLRVTLIAAALSLTAMFAQTPVSPSSSQSAPPRHSQAKAVHTQATAEPTPPAPPPPDWPINDSPKPASIKWENAGLTIGASNSSLKQILDDVGSATGTKIEGFGQDQRVFGNFGPGPARDVLSQLLLGSGYNVVMIGDQATGAPCELLLSGRKLGGASQPAAAHPTQDESDDDAYDSPIDTQPLPQPQAEPPMRFPPDGAAARTPQQIQQELQQRQQQLLQQQQQMQQQQQTTNPPPN